jgi:hypothetical protein
MNNEPVAWIDKRTNKCVVFINTPPSDDWIPLYTHPSKHDLGIAEAIGFDKGYKAAKFDCYGDGNVYRGVRSKDSEVKTYVFDEHAGKQVWSNPAKTLTDEEIEDCYQLWRSLSGDPAKLYQSFKLKEQER